MKKILVVIICSLVLFLSGCSNSLKSNPDGVKLFLTDEIIQHMPYHKEDIPFFVFSEDYNLNTIANNRYTFQEILSGNDDFIVSDLLTALFNKYEDNIYTKIDSEAESRTTRINRIEIVDGKQKVIKETLVVDEEIHPDTKEPLRVIYDEIAFILLENGLQLSVEYRRFTSNGITYYAWRYTRSMMLYLHYPLMVYKNEAGNNQLVILPLPNYTKYSVGPQLTLKKLINEDTYLNDDYYNFSYDPEQKDEIIDFYLTRHNGVLENDILICSYLGIDFEITFTDNHFKITKL